jgi:hypothetical protein
MKGFKSLKEYKQLYCEPACQKDTKTERYKGRQIPKFKVSLGQSEFRSRHGWNFNLRTGFHEAKFIVCAYKCRQIPEFICNAKKKCLLSVSKNQGAGNMEY